MYLVDSVIFNDFKATWLDSRKASLFRFFLKEFVNKNPSTNQTYVIVCYLDLGCFEARERLHCVRLAILCNFLV